MPDSQSVYTKKEEDTTELKFNDSPDISVVVPVYNVEEYLEECLQSLLRQGFVRTEIIMIDDGSTDSSGAIADRYAGRYKQMRVYHIENGGLGHARNLGITYATGKYLMFLDSDDLLTDFALERMYRIAERDESDLTICNVYRFDSKRQWSTFLMQRALFKLPRIAHISRNESLIYDTISTNKLIRRVFFLEHGFRFEENTLYEDMLLACVMHHRANRVSVDQEVGYLWRERDGGTRSITQNKTELRNLRDRIRVSGSIGRYLQSEGARDELLRAFYYKVLDVDLSIFINNCDVLDDAAMTEMLSMINRYIDESIDLDVLKELPILQQAKYRCVRDNNLEELRTVRSVQKEHNTDLIVTEQDGRLFSGVPFCGGVLEKVDSTAYLTRLAPSKYIDAIRVGTDRIEIDAHIYRRRINLPESGDQHVEAWLCNEISDCRIPLEVTPKKIEKLTEQYGVVSDPMTGQAASYNYNGAGSTVTIPMGQLEETPSCDVGTWVIRLKYQNRFETGEVILSGAGNALMRSCQGRGLHKGGCRVSISFGFAEVLRITIEREAPLLRKLQKNSADLQLELDRDIEHLTLLRNGNCPQIWVEPSDPKMFLIHSDVIPEGEQFHLYAEDQKGNRQPVYAEQPKLRLLKINNGTPDPELIVCDSTGDGRVRLLRSPQVILAHKYKLKNDRAVYVAKIEGQAFPSRVIRAELLAVNTETGEGTVLCKGRKIGFGRSARYLFRGKFGKKEMKNPRPYGTMALYICCHLNNGEKKTIPAFILQ